MCIAYNDFLAKTYMLVYGIGRHGVSLKRSDNDLP